MFLRQDRRSQNKGKDSAKVEEDPLQDLFQQRLMSASVAGAGQAAECRGGASTFG